MVTYDGLEEAAGLLSEGEQQYYQLKRITFSSLSRPRRSRGRFFFIVAWDALHVGIVIGAL